MSSTLPLKFSRRARYCNPFCAPPERRTSWGKAGMPASRFSARATSSIGSQPLRRTEPLLPGMGTMGIPLNRPASSNSKTWATNRARLLRLENLNWEMICRIGPRYS
ncbi:MAG: hypothetical protein KAR73_06615 [Spirochaetales bacterium]|nr:hypothetical protein [Spirochaetales bacterium]